ncbi:DUF6457 domain-containing protein [Streptomyces sp. NPDC050418]|uniref:DUF6457 domain-containing protein n=1 Tax=Streptomyces sp. NPDC050418 TaxID=3365612 RepID=UPI0037A48235
MTTYDAVVLAGGAGRRLGGVDKPAVQVGGRALLDRVLAACADARTTVVVAPPRPTVRPVVWTREEPPGGGPLAALAAGVEALAKAHAGADAASDLAPDPAPDLVLVLSADLPFLTEATVTQLLGALEAPGHAAGDAPGHAAAHAPDPPAAAAAASEAGAQAGDGPEPRPDGTLFTDPTGRDQPLVAVYRRAALHRELDRLQAEHGGLAGLPLRLLTAGLALTRVSEPDGSRAVFDCDTWEDIAEARARIREHERVLDEWITAVKDELGLDLDVDTALLLDLARDAAHGVARPAAPLTTFLVGYAAARSGGGPEAVAEATRKAVALANRWADEDRADEDRPDTKPDPA